MDPTVEYVLYGVVAPFGVVSVAYMVYRRWKNSKDETDSKKKEALQDR